MNDRLQILFDAFLITIAVFIIGIAINRFFDSYRLNVVLANMNQDSIDQQSIFLQRDLYVLSNNKTSYLCHHLTSVLRHYKSIISKYGNSLDTYGQIADSYKGVYKLIQDDFFISQLYFYNLVVLLKNQCHANIIPLLFVYKTNSERSLLQGYTLENLEKTYDNVFVSSLSLNFSKRMHIANSPEIIYQNKRLKLLQTDTKLIKELNLSH